VQQERLVVVHQRRITGKSVGWRRINLNVRDPLGVLTSLFPCRSSQIFAFLQEPCGSLVGLSQFCGVRIVAFTQPGRSGAVEGWQRQYDSIRDRASGLIHLFCSPMVLRNRPIRSSRHSRKYYTIEVWPSRLTPLRRAASGALVRPFLDPNAVFTAHPIGDVAIGNRAGTTNRGGSFDPLPLTPPVASSKIPSLFKAPAREVCLSNICE
jgi:hypothetical protein